MIKSTLKQTKFEDKTVKSTKLSLAPVGLPFSSPEPLGSICNRPVASPSFPYHVIKKRRALGTRMVGLHEFSRPYGACVKRASEKHMFGLSFFSSESAVKNLHVGRRKIQISHPLGEQDQSNAPPQGQQRQSNSHPIPCSPPPPPLPA